MKYQKYVFLLFISFFINISAGFFDYFPFNFNFNKAVSGKDEEKLIISPGIQEKQHQLNILKKEKESLESTEKEFNDETQSELNFNNKRIEEIKDKLKDNTSASEQEYLNKVLSKLNETSQAIIDSQIKRRRILNLITQQIEILENYIKDPSFKNKLIESKSSYNIDTLFRLQKEIANYESELSNLNDAKLNIESSLEVYKKQTANLDKELKNKEKEQKKFSPVQATENNKDDKMTVNQKAELLDLEVNSLRALKRLDDLKVKEENQKLALINTHNFIDDTTFKILKNNLALIEKSLLVTQENVETANKQLIDKRRESTELQAKYSEEIRRISQEKEKYKQEFEKLNKKYKLPDLRFINDWSVDAKSLEYEPGLYELGYINDRISTFDKAIALKEAQRDYEKERIRSEEVNVEIIDSWHKISQRKFKTEDEIEKQGKKFQLFKDDLNKDLINYKDKINSATNTLNNLSRINSNISEKIKSLNERSEKFVSNYSKEALKKSALLLSKSEEQIKIQIDIINKIIDNYSGILASIRDSIQKISNILIKIENINGILIRSKYAISWDNIKNIMPDLKLFFVELFKTITSNFSKTNVKAFYNHLSIKFLDLGWVLKLFTQLLLLMLLYLLMRKVLPIIYSLLLSIKPGMFGVYFVNCTMAVIIGFIIEHFLGIYIWSIIFLFTKTGIINDTGIKVIFYLFSIFYLCYLAHKFGKYLLAFNAKNNYVLLNENFQHRFVNVLLFFVYSTIIIFFFIEAFISITYGKSELPTILLALYSIIFRASLICLIGKDEILNIIPEKSAFWNWIRSIVNRYYYLLLIGIITIIIISDPYIGGFSRLVSYILWGTLFTILLFTALWWLQILLRRVSSTIFFKKEDDEAAKERFQYAKTFYGFFSILSFLFFIALAIFVGAKIWDVPLSFEKITEFVNVTIFSVRGEAEQFIPITLKSFIVLFTFLFFGFLVAGAFNRFILRRIFDILLVDQGVQNTVSGVIYYFIVIIILLVGLLRIGLGGLIPFLVGALAVGLAFAIKGPANDFIGYFIILLERSIKIGDYVALDEETKGVVRKITPRSIVIRRKNSVSVIVPNSRITNESFSNWNYVPGFIAFEDITLTVPFTADPSEIIELLKNVISSNPNILKSPAPIVYLDDFAENGYVFRLRGFLSSTNVSIQWDVSSDIRVAIVKALREKGIQIASPTRKLHVIEGISKSNLENIKNNINNQ